MVLIEMRESAYNKVFDLVDEAMDSNKNTKMVLCDLYDHLCNLYDSEKENIEEMEEYESNSSNGDENSANISIDELNYRSNMRRGMRNRMRGMRRGMRSDEYRSNRSTHMHSNRYSY